MAIRFQCSLCAQPIEIDDEWASKLVACPYCRKTVTAPAESTLDENATVPTATPLAGTGTAPLPGMGAAALASPGATPLVDPGAAPPYPQAYAADPDASAQPNPLATVALVLGCILVALNLTYCGILMAYGDEIRAMQPTDPSAPFAEQMQHMMEQVGAAGGVFPAWLIVYSMLMFAIVIVWLGTLGFGIAGIRRTYRRPRAIAALVIAGVVPIVSCCGGSFLVQV